MWGWEISPSFNSQYYKDILKLKKLVNLEDAIFRKESLFQPANLQNHLKFWEEEILKDHSHEQSILSWLTGVKIEEFLNSFTTTVFQGQQMHSYYPEQRQFENYVPLEFQGL